MSSGFPRAVTAMLGGNRGLRRVRPEWLGLGAVLAFALFLRIVFWYGLVNVDPYAYADGAASLARNQPAFDPKLLGALYYTQYIRLSLVAPAAMLYAAFGPGEVVSTLFPMACSLGTAVVAYILALKGSGGDARAGLIAAFLAGVFPLSVINSTQFLPDTVLAFFCGLALLLFWQGIDCRELPWRRRALLFFLTGIAWGLALYARQTAAGLAIPFVALILLRRRFNPALLAGVFGGLGVLGVMNVLLVTHGGEPLEDIRTVINEGRGSQPGALGYTDLDWSYIDFLLNDRMFVPTTGLAALGLGLSVAHARAHGGRRAWLQGPMVPLLLFATGLYLYYEFLMRLPSLYSWVKESRYVLTLVLVLAVIAGIGLSQGIDLVRGRARLATGAAAASLLGLMLFFSVDSIGADHAYWEKARIDAVAQRTAEFLNDRDEAVVYVWNSDFAYYLAPHVGLSRTTNYDRAKGRGYLQNRFDAAGRSRVTPGSLVVIDEAQDVWSKATAHASHWQEVWRDRGQVVIYQVPEIASQAAAPGAVASTPVSGTVHVAVAIGQPWALRQQHIEVQLTAVSTAKSVTVLQLSTDCGSGTGTLVEVPVPSGATFNRVDLAVDAPVTRGSGTCAIVASAGAGWVQVGSIVVPFLLPLVPEARFSHDPQLERSRGSGWFRADQPFFTDGGAAVALEPFRPLTFEFPALAAGDYWLDLAVYDYGTGGENSVTIRLNGIEREVRWGSDTPGVVHRVVAVAGAPAGGDLTIMPKDRGQDGITIDDIVLVSVAPPDAAR